MRLQLLLANSVFAINYLLFQWHSASSCETPPDIVYYFPVSSEDLTTQLDTEVWPFFYGHWAPFYPDYSCGNLEANIPGLCCSSPITPANLHNITSATVKAVSFDENLHVHFLKSSNGAQYCKLFSEEPAGVAGYLGMFIKVNGPCVDSYFKCTEIGLEVYSEPSCTGDVSIYPLSSRPQVVNDSMLGVFNGSKTVINDGNEIIIWTEYIPGQELVPIFQSAFEVIATALYVILCCLQCASMFVVFYRSYTTTNSLTLLHATTTFFWGVYIATYLPYVYIAYDTELVLQKHGTAIEFIYNIATLLTSIYSAQFLFLFWDTSKKIKYAIFAQILIIHFALAGSGYFYALSIGTLGLLWLNTWSKIKYLWITYLIFWDLVPIFAVLAKVSLHLQGIKKRAKFAWRIDLIASLLIVTQIIILVSYFGLSAVLTYSNILGNDRNFHAAAAILKWFIIVHCSTNMLIMNRIGTGLKRASYVVTQSTTTKSKAPGIKTTASSKITQSTIL
jgi:hypothetical protein